MTHHNFLAILHMKGSDSYLSPLTSKSYRFHYEKVENEILYNSLHDCVIVLRGINHIINIRIYRGFTPQKYCQQPQKIVLHDKRTFYCYLVMTCESVYKSVSFRGPKFGPHKTATFHKK